MSNLQPPTGTKTDEFPIYDPTRLSHTPDPDPAPGGPVTPGNRYGVGSDQPRRKNRSWVPAVAIVGALAIGSIYYGPWSSGIDGDRTTPVNGAFTAAQVEVESGAVSVQYADVPQALIKEEHRRRNSRLTQRVDGSTLRVELSDRRWFSFGPGAQVTLVLPRSMEATAPNLDIKSHAGRVDVTGNYGSVKLDSSAGAVITTGTFRDIDAHSSAGEVRMDATAATVKADSSAGRIDLRLRDTKSLRAKSSAGSTSITMSGVQPDNVDARSSAGRVDVDLPDGSYRINADSSAGRAEVESLVNDPNSPHVVEAHSSAGGVRVF